LIFVTGGNQGSHFINRLIFDTLPKLSDYQILHQVGTANFEGDLDKAKKIKRANYLALDYISGDNIGAIFNRADLTISRSGANTVWDLAILAKIAILVPLPISAGGEQMDNAKILEKAGSVVILDQKDLTTDVLKQKIDYMFKNLPKFQKSAQTLAKTLPKSASSILASEIHKLIED
jgi:UDP-N-acetylglucosamine--N-acetylmuramyl-(pentapeptide) pyrophosphoryl-undecaprenol N-acetylglucosamine transferase